MSVQYFTPAVIISGYNDPVMSAYPASQTYIVSVFDKDVVLSV